MMPSLYDVFLDGQRPEVTWQELWRTLAAHPDMLKHVNYTIVKMTPRIDQCRVEKRDMVNDCYLALAACLKKDKSMRFDFARLEKFEAWLCRIIRNACICQLRRYKRQCRTTYAAPEITLPDTDTVVVEDLIEYLSRDEAERMIMGRIADGHSLLRSLEDTGLSYDQARRRIIGKRRKLAKVCA